MTRTVLTADAAFDATSGDVLRDVAIFIDGERIESVGRRDDVEVPADATLHELPGRTLLPGLIDAHVHLDGTRSFDPADRLVVPHDLAVLRAARDCRSLLMAGFTTVRDCGSAIALSLRQGIDEGTLVGPDIVAAGPIISQTGGHSDIHYLPLDEVRRDPAILLADGPDECRRAVRQVIRSGADFIKICTTGGIGSERDHPTDEHFTADELAAIVGEAHRAGKRVAAHAQGKRGILAAVRAGVDSIEHGYHLDEECAGEMLAAGTWLVPTCALIEVFARGVRDPEGLPASRARKQAEAVQVMPEALRLAYRRGVPLATGSDYLGLRGRAHGDNADEIQTMVRHGIEPADALRFATAGGAGVIGDDRIGVLAPGRQADVIAVAGDPLADIDAVRQVDLVMKRGRIVERGD